MRLRHSVSIALALLGSACFSTYPSTCAELLNPSDLSLNVVSTEITSNPTICASTEGLDALFPDPGSKLVRVVLEGRVTRPGHVILPDAAFTAVFDKPDRNAKGAAPAAAMCVNGGLLIASAAANFRQYTFAPGSISITLIFAVPEEVNVFQVTYPAVAAGVASLATRAAALRPLGHPAQ